MKTCQKCSCRLPLRKFPLVNGKPQAQCSPCLNTARRLRDPLPELGRDAREVRINNTFNLWHGPVSRVLLRSHA
ncbi:hypothetical protein [Stenotrophomonas sp.]|uniref:hypothetical protein n=1 Tax=Stenotrophomonas sp. TaxID=69392 RepID=UPI0028AFD470|nr:hypothetical protein [Stenotrophomonas sp.]